MSPDRKKNWKCPSCKCKVPKTGNLDTPVRPTDQNPTQKHDNSPESNNITLRKRTLTEKNDTSSFENTSILGDTICSEKTEENITHDDCANLTLQNISEIIIQRLQENNINIISQLQNTIQKEVQKAINSLKEELKQDVENLYEQNRNRMKEIEQLSNKIDELKNENYILKKEIQNIEKKIIFSSDNKSSENNRNKIVLYGLPEYYKEPECDLYDRIHRLFWNPLRVDLTGYIEDAHRIGRYNRDGNRPLVVELISKRMVKYLLENRQCLQESGLSISAFLDRSERMKLKTMREEMHLARKKGLHAVLRNNQLYVEGKLVTLDERTHESSITTGQKNKEKEQNITDLSSVSNNNDYNFRTYRTTI